ncbi:hypothetical protein BDV12DRAFT_174323 [Aspergillus spectabilis]
MSPRKYAYGPVSSTVEEGHPDPQPHRISPFRHRVGYAILIVLNFTLIGICFRLNQLNQTCVRPRLSYSPALAVLSYEPKRLKRDIDHNPFTGDPRPEFDAAWKYILEPMTIKITASELSHLPDPSIPFADGSGYIAELAAYHELHCIKRIRRHLHLDRYYPNMTEDERLREEVHVDHCLEYWREAAMCRGDTTLATFRWVDGLPYSRVYSDHECVNWEAIDKWARERMVDMSDYSILSQYSSMAREDIV